MLLEGIYWRRLVLVRTKLNQFVADLRLDKLILPMLHRAWSEKSLGQDADGSWCGIWKHSTE
jgi:hypothetical protein